MFYPTSSYTHYLILSCLLAGFTCLLSIGSVEAAEYVGRESCKVCHQQQDKNWSGSPHDLAMQDATEKTVLGDFNNARFKNFDLETTFYRKADKFMVRTDGPDGKLHDYEIRYTFGVFPLQQYLIPFPDGRLQVLDIAWDRFARFETGLCLEALEIWRKVLGEEHPWYATNLNNLAVLYQHMGEFAESARLHRQALTVRRKVLGDQHPDTAQSLSNLADLHCLMGDLAGAEPLYRQALTIRRSGGRCQASASSSGLSPPVAVSSGGRAV